MPLPYTPTIEEEEREALRALLVGPHRKLYMASAEFHAWVDMTLDWMLRQREAQARAAETMLTAHVIETEALAKGETWPIET